MAESGYRRVLLKLSGEALAGGGHFGLDVPTLSLVAEKIAAAHAVCPEMAVVVGAGNFLRGTSGSGDGGGMGGGTAGYARGGPPGPPIRDAGLRRRPQPPSQGHGRDGPDPVPGAEPAHRRLRPAGPRQHSAGGTRREDRHPGGRHPESAGGLSAAAFLDDEQPRYRAIFRKGVGP